MVNHYNQVTSWLGILLLSQLVGVIAVKYLGQWLKRRELQRKIKANEEFGRIASRIESVL